MSFGKKPVPTPAPIENIAQKSQQNSEKPGDGMPIASLLLGGLVFIVAVVFFTFMPAPFYVYSEPMVYYSMFDLAHLNAGQLADPEKRGKFEQDMSVDYSQILYDPEKEQSDYLKLVADSCMRGDPIVEPVLSIHSMPAYQRATEFLICAMGRQKPRFCHESERARLAGQLRQYLKARAHLLGLQNLYREMLKMPGAQYSVDMMKKMSDFEDKPKKPRRQEIRIPEKVDTRIGRQLQILNEEGYFTSADFGWMGLILPAEYAPYLAEKPQSAPAC